MGQNQRSETAGLIAGLFSMLLSALLMSIFLDNAPAVWLVAGRRRLAGSAIVAVFSSIAFVVGYARHSRSWDLRSGWRVPVRRLLEIVSLTVVYATTIFFIVLAALTTISNIFGAEFGQYLVWLVGGLAAVSGYIVFVQGSQLSAKTVASLLPFFVVSGVTTAGMTSDDPVWWRNNFSQLGDRTTFAATLFNYTIVMAGICIIIISYFSLSELITNYRLSLAHPQLMAGKPAEGVQRKDGAGGDSTGNGGGLSRGAKLKMSLGRLAEPRRVELPIRHFMARIIIMGMLLILTALCFMSVGLFRYTPHPILHNVGARGLAFPLTALMVFLPWLAPQLSKTIYVVSDLIIVVISASAIDWVRGGTTFTNVEALAVFLFMAWFVIFSRQIAAMEADRLQSEMLMYSSMYANGSQEIASRLSPAT